MATQILFTAIALACLVGCFLAYARIQTEASLLREAQADVLRTCLALKSERDRLGTNERDIDAVRREVRKLSGKFYAELKAREDEAAFDEDLDDQRDATVADFENRFPVCQNWIDAKQQGPRSDAAKCECRYCLAQRAERARLRGELVPRTVQGQAELARLNAAKP